MKTITYNAETWLKAEKYFSTIQLSKLNGSSVKFHVGGEMFLVSDTWGEYKKSRVPTRTGKTGKPGKMGRHFPVREKSGNFEQTGKVREKSGKTTQNTGKLREFQKKNICSLSMIFK